MRLEVGTTEQSTPLRDYFLRLGAHAVVVDGSSIEVEFPDDPMNENEDIGVYLRSWIAVNDVPAALAPHPAGELTGPVDAFQPARIGDLLVSKGLITGEQLAAALVEARETGQLLGRVLLRHGWLFESDLARTLAERWGLPYLNLASIGVNKELLRDVPRETGLRAAAVPVRRIDGVTQVAFADPSDESAVAAVREYITDLVPAVAELSEIELAWRAVPEAPPQPTPLPAVVMATVAAPEMHTPKSRRPLIGSLFLKKGILTPESLDLALQEQQRTGKRLGEILVGWGLIDRVKLASVLGEQWAAKPIEWPETPAPEPVAVAEPEPEPEPEPVVSEVAPIEAAPIENGHRENGDGELDDVRRAIADLGEAVKRLQTEVEEHCVASRRAVLHTTL